MLPPRDTRQTVLPPKAKNQRETVTSESLLHKKLHHAGEAALFLSKTGQG